MRIRPIVLTGLAALGLAACSDQRAPTSPEGAQPLAAISDGAHTVNGAAGNPDFFFLPPLQPSPRTNANFDPGHFNPHLSPTVKICNGRGLNASGDDCATPLMKNNQPVVFQAVRGWDGLPDWVDPEQYHVLWRTRDYKLVADGRHAYRILVKVGRVLLGFLDVVPTNQLLGALRITAGGQDVGWLDDLVIPIRFRIESGALCPPTYAEGCVKTSVAAAAGVADTIILPSGAAALVIPAGAVAPGDVVDIEATEQLPPYTGQCLPPSLLGQSDGCYSFSATDVATQQPYTFVSPVKVEICVAIPDAMTPAQADLLRLFKYNPTDGVQQWPWAEPTEIDCSTYSPLEPTGGGLGAAALRTLGRWAARLLAPRPLYAAAFGLPPKGIGGDGTKFSDFGGGLESSIAPYHWTDDPQLPTGTAIYDSVVVRDAAGNPVSGVHVTFRVETGGGKVTATAQDVPADSVIVTTDADGLAGSVWTLGPAAGTNTLTASAYEYVGSPVAFTATATAAIPAACNGVTEIPAIECAALVALYNATDGPHWYERTGWLQTTTPCGWYGVSCVDGRVDTLWLHANRLSGTIPSEIGDLTALKSLQLDSNLALSGTIPASIGNLSQLSTIYMPFDALTGPLPSSLNNLTHLADLNLSFNQLTGEIPDNLGNPAALQSLSLAGNRFSGAIPTWLGSLSRLYHLDLSNNELSGAVPGALGGLAELRYLALTGNQLTGEIPAQLGGLGNLQFLYLDQNGLSGAIPAALGGLTGLQALRLYHNQLSGAIPSSLGGLTGLEVLDLRENQLTGAIPSELGALAMLDQLYLSTNQLTGTIPSSLGNLTRLRAFMADGNQLTGQIPATLGDLTQLEGFRLESNQLTGLVPLEVALVGGKIYSGNCTFTPGNAGLYVPDTPAYRAADVHQYGSICGVPFTFVPVGSVEVTPAGARAEVGGAAAAFSAVARDAQGNPIPGVEFSWGGYTGIAQATEDGVYEARGTGQETIYVAGGDTGYAVVTAVQPGVPHVTDWAYSYTPSNAIERGFLTFGANDIYASGALGTVARWDGASWNVMPTDVSTYLYALWGTGPQDIFAVGAGGTITHYNGWSTMTWSTQPSGTTGDLTAVWGASKKDVYAGGTVSASGVPTATVLLHFDGANWSPVSGLPACNGFGINAIWGSSSQNVFASCGTGTILHYNGSAWTAVTPVAQNLYALWGVAPDTVYAVGTNGYLLRYRAGTWEVLTSDALSGLTDPATLHGLWGTSSDDFYAVGLARTSTFYHSVVYRYDGSTGRWIATSLGNGWQAFGITGYGSSNAYVIGSGSVLYIGTR
jgi:Leucine-rich repeat (LRR) protein